jgi:hypothetical protein
MFLVIVFFCQMLSYNFVYTTIRYRCYGYKGENVILFLQTQQLGPTSANPNNTKVISPSGWLIDIRLNYL